MPQIQNNLSFNSLLLRITIKLNWRFKNGLLKIGVYKKINVKNKKINIYIAVRHIKKTDNLRKYLVVCFCES